MLPKLKDETSSRFVSSEIALAPAMKAIIVPANFILIKIKEKIYFLTLTSAVTNGHDEIIKFN